MEITNTALNDNFWRGLNWREQCLPAPNDHFSNFTLWFTRHNTARICFLLFFPSLSLPFSIHSTALHFIGIFYYFGQKTAPGGICWLYKGKSNFEKLRGKQDFLILLGFRYNFPKLTYGMAWGKVFHSLKTQMLNDSEWFWLVFWRPKMAFGKMVGVLQGICNPT